MQPLRRTLEDHDLGHLRILAELWEVDLPSGGARPALAALVEAMLAPGAAEEVFAGLPASASAALQYLLSHGGRAPLADLAFSFGPLRTMGPSRRDREKPWLDRQAALDALYYRGLLARAFADSPKGPLEYGFVPQDLMERLPRPSLASPQPLGRSAADPARHRLARTSAADDATTLLAALRRRPARATDLTPARQAELGPFLRAPDSLELVAVLLVDLGVLRAAQLRPELQATRSFLGLLPDQAATQLRKAWLGTRLWNDLAHTPDITTGARRWPNDPVVTRASALSLFRDVPANTWWDLAAFVEDVRRERPAFERPGGDFDSWYLQDSRHGHSLTGIGHWEAVDGRLLRYLVEAPLAWLGAVDLGWDNGAVVAFRKTAEFAELLGEPVESRPPPRSAGTPAAVVTPDGIIRAPASLPAVHRYQIARFALWVEADPESFLYRLTPSALAAAKTQGLSPVHVRSILEKASGQSLPSSLATALARWGKRGTEARVEATLLLETAEARVLRELQAHRATARYLGEAVGPTAVRVRARDFQPLLEAAARLGILIEPPPAAGAS